MNYESELFTIAPRIESVMLKVKILNNHHFLRPRTGWLRRNVSCPEGIYEHSCKMGLASYYLLGTNEALDIGICHDFPEIYEPDHVPGEIEKGEKKRRELQAMQRLEQELPNGEYWFRMWQKYENREDEGVIIAELDKLCPCVQALKYKRMNFGTDLDSFLTSAREKIKTLQLLDLLENLECLNPKIDVYEAYFQRLDQIQL